MAAAAGGNDGSSTAGSRTPVWLDCDPGYDDAFAIILAGHSPKLQLLGVVPGAAGPLLRTPLITTVHGTEGLGGVIMPPLPPSMRAVDEKAINVMFKVFKEHYAATGNRVTLIATGALTNVGLLLAVYPEAKPFIKEIVLMGGAVGAGNMGPVQEFNIFADPDAAAIVYQSGVPLTMVPLEVTYTALVTKEVTERIGKLNSIFAEAMRTMLMSFQAAYLDLVGMPEPPLHDPCAVAYVINPDMFYAKKAFVAIERCSPITGGATVCDMGNTLRKPDAEKNCTVALRMDVPAFWNLMLDALAEANKVSPWITGTTDPAGAV